MIIKLRVNKTAIDVFPERGASVLKFSHAGQDIFRPTPPPTSHRLDPLLSSCFPLTPYSNRIKNASFKFEGEVVNLSPEITKFEHALHGHGWQAAWHVDSKTEHSCQCSYEYKAGVWPWNYKATQHVELFDGKLVVRLSVKNMSRRNMPCGLGLHPYFPDAATARLKFSSDGVWYSDKNVLPDRWAALPEHWNFNQSRSVRGANADNCFTGYKGQAEIEWPEKRFRLKIQADNIMQFAVLYVPEGEDFFCFEPVSHMNDAANWSASLAGTGWVSLPPGESLTSKVEFIVV